jgi:uncharacterized protein YjbJ (UPF0337 family)
MAAEQKIGPEAGAAGGIEDVKGRIKEAAGALVGNDDVREEGRAQQDTAAAEQQVALHEGEARAARAEAAAHEANQRAHQ